MNSNCSLNKQSSYKQNQNNINSNDSLLSIVFHLMTYSVCDESLARRAIESLVKKLKEKKNELDILIDTITSRGENSAGCITIFRTLDNRLQVAGKKGFPHVFYVKVWRWPNVHRNDLKHLNFCEHPFDSKSSLVCVNPYHYERIVSLKPEIQTDYTSEERQKKYENMTYDVYCYDSLKKEKNRINYRFDKLIRPSHEYWCSFAYFELNEQVGQTYRVLNKYDTVTIDGYVDPTEENRFCLGALSNSNRTPKIDKVRMHIGKGVRLSIVENGDVYLECLSDQAIFVQSYYLDRQIGRVFEFLVHKFHKSAVVKIFDFEQVHNLIKEKAIANYKRKTYSLDLAKDYSYDIEHLKKLCILRLSFVKGWGLDYIRKFIEDTPCWVEIKLYKPLLLIDEI